MGGGEGQAEVGARDHDERAAQLDAEAAARRDFAQLDTDCLHAQALVRFQS